MCTANKLCYTDFAYFGTVHLGWDVHRVVQWLNQFASAAGRLPELLLLVMAVAIRPLLGRSSGVWVLM